MSGAPEAMQFDTLIKGALLVTMDATRRIIKDGAIGIAGDRITWIGKASDTASFQARETIDGRRFAATPGFINGHIHITGEPITRGFIPDNTGFSENVWGWLVPLYNAQTPEDERISAQFAALEMLRNGITSFIEAGTIRHLDEVVDALGGTGIRGRVGQWCEDRAFDPSENQTAKTDAAAKVLDAMLARYSPRKRERISAWPSLVGHMTCTDELWKIAAALAKTHGAGVSAHMSPVDADPEWYVANTGKRPIAHLASHDVLSDQICFTHAIHLDLEEVSILAQTNANVTHCPMAALKGAYGATAVGKFPEMQAQGVNIMLGTDGANNGNSGDLMRAMYLLAGLFKDARRDPNAISAYQALEAATINGARGLGMASELGALAVGMKADIVLHDLDRPEWRPVLNPVHQLVWSADGRGIHSVWVDGQRVVDAGRCTTIDEERLYAEVERLAPALIARAGLSIPNAWPVI